MTYHYTCQECGGSMRSVREDHRYYECGLSNVLLKDVEFHLCSCGEKNIVIPCMGPLHRAIMMALLKRKGSLNREERTFVRKVAASDVAENVVAFELLH